MRSKAYQAERLRQPPPITLPLPAAAAAGDVVMDLILHGAAACDQQISHLIHTSDGSDGAAQLGRVVRTPSSSRVPYYVDNYV